MGWLLRGSSVLTLGLALVMALAAAANVSTHRRDEYLQAARIAVEPNGVRIELDLTPGIDVATSIVAAIDTDRDGSWSTREQDAYVRGVIDALELTVDGARLPLRLVSATFPELTAVHRGEGTIRLQVSAVHAALGEGAHRLDFRNRHLGGRSAYMANALVPESAGLSVTEQRRDKHQRTLAIEYLVGQPPSGGRPPGQN